MKFSLFLLFSLNLLQFYTSIPQLNLTQWFLQLPTGGGENGNTLDEVKPPTLAPGFSNEFFYPNAANDAYVFHSPIDPPGAAVSAGTGSTRSELRESPFGVKNGYWVPTSGTHTLTLTQAVTQIPNNQDGGVITAQIHNGNVPVLIVRLNVNVLSVFFSNFPGQTTVLDGNYQLGTKFSIELQVVDGKMYVLRDGGIISDCGGVPITDAQAFFKTGSYNQNTLSSLNPATASADVEIYTALVQHDLNLHTPPQKCTFRFTTGLIAGIVCGCIALVVIIFITCICCNKKRQAEAIPKVYGGFQGNEH